MDRTDALDQAAAFVERLGGHSFRTGNYARVQAVLDVAAFLLGETAEPEADTEPTEGAPYLDPSGERVPLGPARKVMCQMDAGDYVYARAGKINGVPYVAVMIVVDGDPVTAMITPRDARAYAAGLLDCADEADGASPSVYGLLTKDKGDDDGSAPTPAVI